MFDYYSTQSTDSSEYDALEYLNSTSYVYPTEHVRQVTGEVTRR